MKRALLKWAISGLCTLLAACAFITVNVYFPEKDVKKAYKSLDEMLLKQGDKSSAPEGAQPAEEPKAPETKPQSMLPTGMIKVAFVQDAYAQEDISGELAAELAGMPEVQTAYREMRARLPQLTALMESGATGEGSAGNVVVRDKGKLGNNQALVDAENNNRKTVINSMAKSLLKITKQPETKETLRQARQKASQTFAATRQEEAKPGWWIQANGRWVRK